MHLVKNTLVSRGLFQVTPTALLSSSAVLYWPVRCGRFLLAYIAEDRKGVKTSGTKSQCLQYSMNPGSPSSDLSLRQKIKYNDSALLRQSIFVSKKISLVISSAQTGCGFMKQFSGQNVPILVHVFFFFP